MRSKAATALLILVVSLSAARAVSGELPQADLPQNVVYPPELYHHNGGHVIDITKPPFTADPSGKTDSTKALVAAYDFVAREGRKSADRGYIIYLPNGTYRVSDTILYTGAPLFGRGDRGHESLSRIRFRGQSRRGSVIRLADASPGFAEGKARPVVSFGAHTQNNSVASSFFEDITIDTGRGNPGAVGLRFHGANNAAVRNVTIRAGDGRGAIGLDMPIGACQGLYTDILVEGFDIGIHVAHPLAKSLTFERVVLRDQRQAGVHLEDSLVSIRHLESRNNVPALWLTSAAGQAVLIDSTLRANDSRDAAIQIDAGYAFVRNVETAGYRCAVREANQAVVSGAKIGEYVTGRPYTLFPTHALHSLNLPIEETPRMPWDDDFSRWASVRSFGATGDGQTDDAAAIQAAMRSGKPIVYFPYGTYLIHRPIEIPPSVERVNFMFARPTASRELAAANGPGIFRITGDRSAAPLLVEDLFAANPDGEHRWFEHAGTRTIVLSDAHAQRGGMYFNSVPGGKVFLDNSSNRVSRPSTEKRLCYHFTGQQVWARFMDPEYSTPEVLVDGGQVWVFGFKTEGCGPSFAVRGGGRLEVLGGIVNGYGVHQGDPAWPVLVVDDSEVTAVLATGGPPTTDVRYFSKIVEETRGGQTRTLLSRELPTRFGPHVISPLYVSGSDAHAPASP
ncbi:MAG: glycosyl hydrolase family 28-related protein [Planctomycetota bacterium]